MKFMRHKRYFCTIENLRRQTAVVHYTSRGSPISDAQNVAAPMASFSLGPGHTCEQLLPAKAPAPVRKTDAMDQSAKRELHERLSWSDITQIALARDAAKAPSSAFKSEEIASLACSSGHSNCRFRPV